MTAVLTYQAEAPAVEVLSWVTDVIEAQDGREQRIALRGKARSEWRLQYLLGDADARALRAQVYNDPDAAYTVPGDWDEVPSLAAITSTTITCDGTFVDWVAVGRTLLVRNRGDVAYTTTITAASLSIGLVWTLTVDTAPPSGVYPAGSAVIPCRTLKLRDGVAFGHYRKDLTRVQLAGVVVPSAVTGIGTGATVTTHDSLPVWDRLILAPDIVQDQNVAALVEIDYGGARAVVHSRTDSAIRRALAVTIGTPAERQWLRLFGQTVLGRLRAFLAPTWIADLVLHAQPAAAATAIVIEGTYVTDWWPSLAHRHLQLLHQDASVTYVTVSNAVDSGGGLQTLTVTSVGAMTSPITMVSLLEKVRLESDEIAIPWGAGARADVALSAVVVRQ